MFPIKDSIPSRSFPVVNWLIIIANVAVFVYQLRLPGGQSLGLFFLEYGLVPRILSLPSEVVSFDMKIIPFFSYMFLHGGWFHIIFNLYTLFIFGDNVEDALGHVRYLFVYLLFGIAAGVVQVLFDPSSAIPIVGASGAIAGVMGAYFILFPGARIKTLLIIIIFVTIVDLPAVIYLGLWFFLQFVSASFSSAAGGGVAWWAHVGGFIVGMLYAVLHISRARRN